ncbi:MAG TPA: hypothetical protein VF475_09075 [Sphingobium sp.]
MLWFHCDNDTGQIVAAGMSCTLEEAQKNLAPEGKSLFIVPDGTVNAFQLPHDFTILKRVLSDAVDKGAGEFSSRFVTVAATQEMRYQEKYSEAVNWTPETDPADVPFLREEADATGQSIEVVATTVKQTRQVWKIIGSKIEGRRMGAKQAIANAETLPAIMAAANVDWESLVPVPASAEPDA